MIDPKVDEIKKEVKSALVKDVDVALELLKENISPDSRKYNDLILLLGQYKSLSRDQRIGIVGDSEVQLRLNRVRHALLYLVDDLGLPDLMEKPEQRTLSTIKGPLKELKRRGALKVFISYAHEDENWKDRLKDELQVLEKLGEINIWDDRALLAGSDWNKEIQYQLANMDIIFLLITRNFIRSDYIWSVEMSKAIERHNEGSGRIIPVIIENVPLYNRLPFSHITALPKDGKPVLDWENADEAWSQIGEEVSRLIDNLRLVQRES